MPSLISSRTIAGHPIADASACESCVLPLPDGPLTIKRVGWATRGLATARLRARSRLRRAPTDCLRGDGTARRRSGVPRLIDADLPTTGQRDLRKATPLLLLDRAAVDLARPHRGDERVDILHEEEQLVPVVALPRMYGDLRRRQAEDEPSPTDVNVPETEHVLQEGSIGIGIGAVDDRVGTADHAPTVAAGRQR